MYRRLIEDQLKEWLRSPLRKPLLLNGARQVGKTFTLKRFAADNFSAAHYFNFEIAPALKSFFEYTLEPSEIITALSIQTGRSIKPDRDILIFDEVQACPEALNSLKYFCEKLPQLALCAAGSLLGVTLSPHPFPVGKVDELELFPLNFYEFLLAIGEEALADFLLHVRSSEIFPSALHTRLWSLWKHYLVTGGLPEVVQHYCMHRNDLLEAFAAVREKQLTLINEYLRDMSKHAGSANALHLERIFRAIPAQLARSHDDSVKRFRFSGVVPGVSQYSRLVTAFDWLAGAGLAYKVLLIDSAEVPLAQHAKENIFKLYVFDTGLLGALGDVPPQHLLDFDFGTYKGYIAENFVLQALKSQRIKNVFGWNEGTAEVEFVISDLTGIVPIEVKSGRVRQAKSLSMFVKRYAPHRAYIFGATPPRDDGTVHRRPIYSAGIGELGRV